MRQVQLHRLWVLSLAFMGASEVAHASVEDANSTLGFEDASQWTVENGAIVGTTTTRTQGAAALVVNAPGYTVLHSRVLGPLGEVSPQLSFDLLLPDIDPEPSWRGATQLLVSAPSQGLYNAYLGQVELTGLAPGVFNRVQFTVPQDVLEKLRGQYSDAFFSIVLNVPNDPGAEYILDNLEVSSTIPPNSTVGDAERLLVLGFESEDAWELNPGSLQGLSASYTTQGNFSYAVRPQGYAVLTSRPLPSIGPVDPVLTFDIRLPAEQPNLSWYGAAQLFVSIPSQGIYSAYVGQNELTPLPLEQFSTLSFSPPPELISVLDGNYYDLEFSIVLNVPYGAPGVYHIDNLQVGALTTLPEVLPPDTPVRRDLVGLGSSGLVYIAAADESASPALTLGAVYVEERDHDCLPSSTRACRYLVHLARFRAGSFSMFDEDFSGVQVFNVDPFEVVMGGGGPSSLSSPIPSNVLFAVFAEGHNKAFSAFPASHSSITVDPSGGGMVAMNASLHTTIDGTGVDFDFSFVADSPLANRPPVANAGPDRVASSSGPCEAELLLDGSASSDPDGNLLRLRWSEGEVVWGTGPTLQARFRESGEHLVTLEALDTFGATSQDEVLVQVSLPPSCE